ncbi:right-handed parallel beta-helix repeat-containing protein, partial [Stella sp.]|uniref:right-handed parallel beta-helix repeat-containing protein n=1 Tax=Stella sp. TaxID=2912054 RepID=UPI0035AF1920
MATTYYVGTPSSGGGDGSEGNPFATITAAIAASSGGDTIDIADGTYTAPLTIAHGLTFVGHGGGTIEVDAAAGAAIQLSGTGLAGETVTFQDLTISGGGTDKIGILTASGADVGGLVLTNVDLHGFVDYGVLTNPGTLGGVTVTGSTFEDNGTSTVNGSAHLHLWGFEGDALIADVTITGAEGVPTPGGNGTNPEFAVQFTGRVNDVLATQPSPDMGTVSIDGLVIQGAFGKNAVAVFNYSNIDGLAIAGDGIDFSGAQAGWNLLNVDGILDDIAAGAWALDLPSGIVATEIQGDKINQSIAGGEDRDQEITATAFDDRVIGKGGSDTLHGGQGDDELYGHDKPGGAQTVDGGDDHLFGGQGNDSLYGGNGADRLSGDLGSDRLDGGEGTDTAVFGAGAVITFAGGQWVVQDGLDADTLTGTEKVEIDGTTYLLVDTVGGAFQSIEAALDAAAAGDTILLAPGVHAGAIIDKSVTLAGLDGAVVKGTFSATNGIDLEQTTVADWLKTVTAYTSTGAVLTVQADDVTIRDLRVEDDKVGIELRTSDGVTIENVTIANTISAIRKEAGVDIDVTDFTLSGGEIRDSYMGVDINATANGSFDGVTIDGTSFVNLTVKGIYAEQLSNATITDVTMDDVGEFGRARPFGSAEQVGTTGAGIDINAKYGDYANITIENFTFTDVGRSNKDGEAASDPIGGAITIKARDDAPSYSADPATLDNVVVRNGSIDGTSTAIRIGEPGKTNAGPTDVSVENVSVNDAPEGAVDNRSQSVLEVTGTTGGDLIDANDSATGTFDLAGGLGADTLVGGPGA